MTTGQGNGMVPAGYGAMRSSSADRERAVDVLKAAFAEGRLNQDEYAERVGLVFTSRTYAELASLTADLPVGPLGTIPPAPVQYAPSQYAPVQYAPGPAFIPVSPPVPAPRRRGRLHPSDLALGALLLGAGAIVTDGLTAPIAIVVGVIAAARSWRSGERGATLAIVAILIAILAVLRFF